MVCNVMFVCVQPLEQQHGVVPDPDAEYHLFDRVVNARENFSVPLGLRGTVIGIKGGILKHILTLNESSYVGWKPPVLSWFLHFFILDFQLNETLRFCTRCCLMRNSLEDSLSGTDEFVSTRGTKVMNSITIFYQIFSKILHRLYQNANSVISLCTRVWFTDV